MNIYSNFTVEDYNYWVFEMDDKLDSFLDSMPAEFRQKLNFSPDSLIDLANWIIRRYQNQKGKFESLSEAIVIDGACRYLGETIRKNYGGYWDIDTHTSDSHKKSVPFITGFGKGAEKYFPYIELKKTLDINDGYSLLPDNLKTNN
jgi:hypothetical protein